MGYLELDLMCRAAVQENTVFATSQGTGVCCKAAVGLVCVCVC